MGCGVAFGFRKMGLVPYFTMSRMANASIHALEGVVRSCMDAFRYFLLKSIGEFRKAGILLPLDSYGSG
jgi:hypothetical protein